MQFEQYLCVVHVVFQMLKLASNIDGRLTLANSIKTELHTVFPHIVSSLKYFPPLNSFLTLVRKLFKFLLHKGKINEETIRNFQGLKSPKKNSCLGNYMRKYGISSGAFIYF